MLRGEESRSWNLSSNGVVGMSWSTRSISPNIGVLMKETQNIMVLVNTQSVGHFGGAYNFQIVGV